MLIISVFVLWDCKCMFIIPIIKILLHIGRDHNFLGGHRRGGYDIERAWHKIIVSRGVKSHLSLRLRTCGEWLTRVVHLQATTRSIGRNYNYGRRRWVGEHKCAFHNLSCTHPAKMHGIYPQGIHQRDNLPMVGARALLRPLLPTTRE